MYFTVRIGTTDHLVRVESDGDRTICGIWIPGTPLANHSDRKCADCAKVKKDTR